MPSLFRIINFGLPEACPRATPGFLCLLALVAAAGADTPEPFNSEKSSDAPLAAEEAASRWELPPGFRSTVFAAEPAVRQPISMCLDDRGRLWVAESYMYAGHSGGYYEGKLRDRIVILEDTDHDGRHDKRTIFAEGLERLTSIEVGMGGVWALTLPQMVFLPDLDRNDVPDEPARVVLDGFDIKNSAHTMANGLRWGPDGWLYGRQGILGTSLIGKPGVSDEQRTRINTGIWRYHPQHGSTELVCEGTTNPWGMDWNAHGEAFFINTVIGHLWHVIPGAHYKRMFGDDHNPHVYELIDQHADHVHWDTSEKWDEIRQGMSKESSSAGGGHAHTGLMIYQGDNWPEDYRGDLFTINFHGRRLNRERLDKEGGGYIGRHRPDLAFSPDPWFRGIDLLYGPDGGVFISDWSDTGECHDDDGVHRLSGRIYKITHGAPAASSVRDLALLPSSDLLPLLDHRNEWFARRSRLLLQQRAASGEDMAGIAAALHHRFSETSNEVLRLRYLWSLSAISKADPAFLRSLLGDGQEHVRVWALRLLLDDRAVMPEPETLAVLSRIAQEEKSATVRLALASALQRLPLEHRSSIAGPLLARAEDAADHNLPLMLWYGIEPLGDSRPGELAVLAKDCAIPLVRIQISRRLASKAVDTDGALDSLLRHAPSASAAWQADLLEGMIRAFQGLHGTKSPAAWSLLAQALAESGDASVKDLARKLGLTFSDPKSIADTVAILRDDTAHIEARRTALRALIGSRVDGLHELCTGSFATPGLTATAAEGLSLEDDLATADWIIAAFNQVHPAEKSAVIGVLILRPAWAMRLLDAIAAGSIPATEISAFQVRQIRGLKDETLDTRIAKLWGDVRDSSADKRAAVAKWEAYLTPKTIALGNKEAGKLLFAATCGACHTMYGQGGAIGPDLTGGGRDNLHYLLANIIDPSAVLAKENQLSILTLKDGRVLSGMIRAKDERMVTLQTLTERTSVPAGDVVRTDTLPVSLMPEGMLDALSHEQVRDLFAWLMDKQSSAAAPSPEAINPFSVSITGDWQVSVKHGHSETVTLLDIAPPAYQEVTSEAFASLPVYNANGGGWNNGAKFAGNLAEECATPDLIDAATVTLRASADPASPAFVRGKDWEMENRWGTFGRITGGAIGEAVPIFASYRHTSLRLDSIVQETTGNIVVRQGRGAPAAPEAPRLKEGERRLANIWIPGPIPRLTGDHLFPVIEAAYPAGSAPVPPKVAEKFPRIMEKLRSGEPLRILAWGDSVTAAGYLPQAEKWQEQFVARLRAKFPQAKIELLSEAWGGRTTSAYLAEPPGSAHNYQEKVLALKPDLVISEFVNDAGLPLDGMAPQYARILTDFKGIGAEWIILTPHYVIPAWMGLSREREIDEDPRPYVAMLRKFAADNPVLLADAARRYGRLWRQGIPYTTLMVNSINHPNARGMTLFADSLMELFEE
ncbi:PVC-type heme-binding CxxCH protein [Luteolibacter luteus]|uniref:C-type cytochrome n=1 Tax=Luteolibacter luteus TaxID=2728835 RepID=A0A858RRD9_9BACT|nr:PVC-type heme-binding CxxCH protein [Luteolibacter luteus]QJE98503.1 c-type cytochrome [Luteolibacter luteus]